MLVTLHVFSGRPHPTWLLEHSIPAYLHVRHILQTHNATELPELLGYTGFTVGMAHESVENHVTIARRSDTETELFLLDLVKTLPPQGQSQPLADIIIQGVQTDILNPN